MRVGSSAYVDGLSADERGEYQLYLNVDMVASPNAGYFVQGGKGTTCQLGPPGSEPSPRSWSTSWPKPGSPPEIIEFVGDDESPFVEAGIPSAGAENGDEKTITAAQAHAWGGQAGERSTGATTRLATAGQRQPRDIRALPPRPRRRGRPLRHIKRKAPLNIEGTRTHSS